MATLTTRVDPRTIRQALADLDTLSGAETARRHGVTHRTVFRWAARREADPSWPSDADIAAWDDDNTRTERRRKARSAALAHDYRKRRRAAAGGRMLIDSTGTTRRLRALHAIGYSSSDLGPRLGISHQAVTALTSTPRPLVHRHTAARIAAVYDDLSMVVPTDPDVLPPRHTRVRARQRRWAATKGWAPPLAWDDIDDPAEQPANTARAADDQADEVVVLRFLDGERGLTTTRADRVEIVARWRAAGRSLRDLFHQTGWRVERYYTPDHRLNEREDAA